MTRLLHRRAGPSDSTSPADPFWHLPLADAYRSVDSDAGGLSTVEATERLNRFGPNSVHGPGRSDALALLARQFANPLVLILVFATVLAGLLGDVTDALIILAIVGLSGLLGFWQERGATRAVDALLAVVEVKAEVIRDGATVEVPLGEIVPGDLVLLNAGDIVPGDGLVVESHNLLVDQAALTGETFPVEKSPGVVPVEQPIAGRTNAVFMGTHVLSGSGRVSVMHTGARTEFGRVSARLGERPPETGFERGMTAFGYLLMRAMIVLVVAIFAVNLVLARPLIDAALFSLALAVGLTPQLLPAIVTISLSSGARLMARERVIVKRLDAIEDFGAMSILCTDKTGTMTVGTPILERAVGLDGEPDAEVRRLAYLNARFQTGFTNPLDAAILAAGSIDVTGVRRLDELPYDFSRRRLSVLLDDRGDAVLVTKGSFDDVLGVCSLARRPTGEVVPIEASLAEVRARFAALSGLGLRVLGVARRPGPESEGLVQADEREMILEGFLAFLDPPKPGVEATLLDLAASGISVRMITGDNELVAAHVGRLVGLSGPPVLTGSAIDRLDDAELATIAAGQVIFAEVEPAQKSRIVAALRASGRVVGYLGDGINDAPALHAADVGISVDTAVDVAKESAAIVLLEKDLRVLLDGVRQGRRTFANTMKYVFTTTSANFGNMLSMAAASAFLPFLPLLADQILLVNLLTDVPATTIATDNVDREQLDRPHEWDIGFIRRFMIVFGAVSSVFDLLTFAVLRIVFTADATLFRSGWFLESVATEIVVLFVLRTRRPAVLSNPSRLLVAASVAVLAVTLAVLYGPLAAPLGLTGLPVPLLLALAGVTAAYATTTEVAKRVFYGRAALGPR